MAINYAKIFNRRAAPQSQPIPGSNQVRNSGGGYSWQVDDWTRLDRFLILGAKGGTIYITKRDLVKHNHDAIARLPRRSTQCGGGLDPAPQSFGSAGHLTATGFS